MAVSDVVVPDGRRTLDRAQVEALAESIKEQGLLSPIGVRPNNELIWGAHRLEACKLIGQAEIDVRVADVDDIHAELMEIDENLQRAELSRDENWRAIARRKELYEALYPETKTGGNASDAAAARWNAGFQNGNPHRPPSFVNDTAKKTRRSVGSVARDVRIGEAFKDEELATIAAANVPVLDVDILAAIKKASPETVAAVLSKPISEVKMAVAQIVAEKPKKRRPPLPEMDGTRHVPVDQQGPARRMKTAEGKVIPLNFINPGEVERNRYLYLSVPMNLKVTAADLRQYYTSDEFAQLHQEMSYLLDAGAPNDECSGIV